MRDWIEAQRCIETFNNSLIAVTAAIATAAPFLRRIVSLLPPSLADTGVFPVLPFPPRGGKIKVQRDAILRRLAHSNPPKCHKVQQRRLSPVYPLHTAVLSTLPGCKCTTLGGNTSAPRVTFRREKDTN